jgi:hypothetical protein
MQLACKLAFMVIAFCAVTARTEAAPIRADLNTDKPIAKCKLQSVESNEPAPPMPAPVNIYAIPRPADDPLANYERTELGNWRMPGEAELTDPWIRLLVVGPKRPVLVDVAVFIDGKSFRQAREAWMDDLLVAPADAPRGKEPSNSAEAQEGNKTTDSPGTDTADGASNARAKTADDDSAKDAASSDDEGVGNKVTSEESDEKRSEDETSKSDDEAKDESKNDEKEESKTPGVTTQSRQMPMLRERLANYLAASGTKVERDEIGWLVAEWGSGPGLIVLDPAHSWQRAGVAMLEALVDVDGDGVLSAQEISESDEILSRADFDANKVVEVSEMRRANRREPRIPFKMGNSLVVILDSNTDWDALAATVANVYGQTTNASTSAATTASIKERMARGDASMTADALRSLLEEPADVSLRVDFGGADAASGVSVVAAGPELMSQKNGVTATENVITVDLGSDYLEISAAGIAGNPGSAASESQIAVGAVIDGNPLLRVLDHDQDQRLTQRERQELKSLLASLDRDSDGTIATSEMPVPIRLAFTLGPHVHQLLAAPAGAARPIAPSSEPAPPDWFASMDKNSDRDLSREEFLGTSGQFKQADADGDGLLNVAEALKLEGGK